MMIYMMMVFLLMYLIGEYLFFFWSKSIYWIVFIKDWNLLYWEFFFFFVLLLNFIDFNMYVLMVFLVFSVCEGALGLSILVSMVRSHGSDYFQSFNLL
uniref:NADH dehydrogenase subunit 4L n=1 Tax=Leucoma salicis TaxID=688415 RepID=UPI002008EE18|nr:NADH dehydrogenase subunit 4L [Leucoma salicis]UOX27467.1 NADH dehydrogenase subunit 4L [Leucoma salicis]